MSQDFVTITQACERLGISRQAFHASKRKGTFDAALAPKGSIPKDPNKQGVTPMAYDFEVLKALYYANTRGVGSMISDKLGYSNSAGTVEVEPNSDKARSAEEAKLVINWKLHTEEFKARKAELEFKIKSGELVSAKEIERHYFDIARPIRDALLNIPSRVAAEIAVMDDPHAVEQYLMAHITQALKDITKSIDQMREKFSGEPAPEIHSPAPSEPLPLAGNHG